MKRPPQELPNRLLVVLQVALLLAIAGSNPARAQSPADDTAPDEKPASEEFVPDQSELPAPPPDGAIVLLGSDEEHRFVSMSGGPANWPAEEGELTSTSSGNANHLVSMLHFRDADIHVEFMLPKTGVGNSGIYIHGNYELQIFNSFGAKKPSDHDMGAIYGFHRPLVNAARKPLEWQVYDIRYRAPRRDEQEKIVESGRITAWLNGKLVQKEAEFDEPRSVYHPYRHGTTDYLQAIWAEQKKTMRGPVFLQDHHNPVRFRNVWIVPLDDQAFFYEPADNEK